MCSLHNVRKVCQLSHIVNNAVFKPRGSQRLRSKLRGINTDYSVVNFFRCKCFPVIDAGINRLRIFSCQLPEGILDDARGIGPNSQLQIKDTKSLHLHTAAYEHSTARGADSSDPVYEPEYLYPCIPAVPGAALLLETIIFLSVLR